MRFGACLAAAMLLGVVTTLGSARADTWPAAGTPATVSADPLPTVQVNGVVWQQVTVGNTVFATGSFSAVRPAGAAPGQQEQPMANLVAFDITTGALLPGFTHSLNAQGMAITAAPDGTKVYVGGDFTVVDGQQRGHIAAFDTATGGLDPDFHPWVNDRVQALSVTSDTVYAGGQFTLVNGLARKNLAAFTTTGGLLDWAPTTNAIVTAMVAVPQHSRVIVGGRFTLLNGTQNYGSGSVDAVTGATMPWAINKIVRNNGTYSAIVSLATDGAAVYGSGYDYGSGTVGALEGSFAADPATGNVIEINNCLGDTYGVNPIGQVLYNVGHPHDCSAIGGFPESPTLRALAETTYATGVNGPGVRPAANFSGQPAGSLLHWFPELSIGSYTGQKQAAFSVTGNANYISLGGEFVAADGMKQQGLVRYAVSAYAPNKRGPVANAAVTPKAVVGSGGVQLTWKATWDRDNEQLTYAVRRDGVKTPIHTTTAPSAFWRLPAMSYTDPAPPAGQHTYTVTVTDHFGRSYTSPPSAPVTSP